MKFEVNVEKKYFFSFLIVGLVIIGVTGVFAYNTNYPSTFGHSVGEIDWNADIPKLCLNGVCMTNWSTVDGSTSITYVNSTPGITDIVAGSGITATKYPNGTVILSATGNSLTGNFNVLTVGSNNLIYSSNTAKIMPADDVSIKSPLVEINGTNVAINSGSTSIKLSSTSISLSGKAIYQVNDGCDNAKTLTFNSTCTTSFRSKTGQTTYYNSCTGTSPYFTYPTTCQNPLV